MKHFLHILGLIFLFCSNSFAQDYTEYYFKFKINDKKELDSITQLISIDNVKGLEVFAYANQQELDNFQELGYKIEFLKKDIPKSLTMATTVAEMANWNRYPTYEVYRQMLKDFESNYPSICKLDSIGTTNNGRRLYVLQITDNINIEENEPEFFYTSTMHGDETTGFILMLRLADSLLSSYGSEANITNLVNEIDIYINPNANPDGTYYGGDDNISNARRYNANGEDLNRDFPDPRTGQNATYQVETQAMMDFAEEHHFIMSANFHGGAEVINYPWDTWYLSENPHTDTDWFEKVCTDYVATTRTVNASYMDYVTPDGVTHGATWYKVAGGRQDYMNYWHQCREVTMEISVTKLLETENLNKYWNYNKVSLLNYMNECLNGIRGTVKNNEGSPLDAMIWIVNHDDIGDSSMVFTDPNIGDYHRLIAAGTYDVIASSEGYISDTAKKVTVTANDAVWLNFELTPISLEITPSCIKDTVNQNIIKNYPIVITNLGKNSVEYSSLLDFTAKTETWISIENENGLIQPGSSDTVFLIVNTNEIEPGTYVSILKIIDNEENNFSIPIQIYVNQIQSIQSISEVTEISLYPNPFNDQLNLEFYSFEKCEIKLIIFNITGNTFFEKEISLYDNEKKNLVLNDFFDVGMLPKGIYFVQISTLNSKITKKLIKN